MIKWEENKQHDSKTTHKIYCEGMTDIGNNGPEMEQDADFVECKQTFDESQNIPRRYNSLERSKQTLVLPQADEVVINTFIDQ